MPVVNVFARLGGTDSTGAIVLMAHYDTVPETTGANDNGTAVAAVLETGRAIRAGPALRNDMILLFTDGEEPAPRYGSTAFVERHPYAKDARLVINLEAVGGSGTSELLEVSGDEGALMSRYAAAVPRPAASSVVDDLVELIGGSNTDMAPFRDAGVAGFEFAYVRGSPIYHTPKDDVASVSLASLQHHGSHMLALTRTFGDLDLTDLRNERQEVFFTLAGRVVLSYPTTLGVVLVLVTGLLLGVVVWTERRAGRLELGRLLRAVGWLLLLVLAVSVLVGLAWRLLVGWLWTGDGPGEVAGVAWLIAILAITVTLTAVFGRRLTGGAPLVLWGYLFMWPVLAATAMSFVRARLAAFAVVAATTLLLAVPVLDFFFQMAQPRPGNVGSQMVEVMAVVALLGSLVTALLVPLWPRAPQRSGT
ncbi:MAG: M28 family peptidase [Planctomycetota bacterium]